MSEDTEDTNQVEGDAGPDIIGTDAGGVDLNPLDDPGRREFLKRVSVGGGIAAAAGLGAYGAGRISVNGRRVAGPERDSKVSGHSLPVLCRHRKQRGLAAEFYLVS